MAGKVKVCLALACLLNTACATVTRGPNVKLHIITDPEGAMVTTDLERKSTKDGEAKFHECAPTPCYIHVSRRAEFTLTVVEEGYHPASVEITSGLGKKGSAVSATGTVTVAASAYAGVYALYTGATLLPAVLTGSTSSIGSGAAAASTQAATGFGVLMLGIDIASGAMLDVRPNPLILILIPEDQPVPEKTYIETKEEFEEFLSSTGRDLSIAEDAQPDSQTD